MVKWWVVSAMLIAAAGGARADAGQPSWLVSPIGLVDMPSTPWKLALLPGQTKPSTQFSVVELDAQRVLRVASIKSYGKLLHPIDLRLAPPKRLRWDWRIDLHPDADLRSRSGDDVALRVCAFYGWEDGDAMPALLAVAIGADSDNTGGEGLAYLRSISLHR